MHIAFIMDGNGRWAIKQGKTRAEGHDAGIETANNIMMACVKRNIKNATFYAFSVQNWSRDRTEIENIYDSGRRLFERMRPWVLKNNVQVRCIGNKFRLLDKADQEENSKVREALASAKELMNETRGNTGTIITLCVSYGGREEILDVFQELQEKGTVLKNLTTNMISDHFTVPDVDLVVRTSGEYRISNFLLWQSAYAEYAFTKTFWPDFSEQELDSILTNFSQRERRFGTIGPKPSLIPFEDLKEIYEELFLDDSEASALLSLYRDLSKKYAFSSWNGDLYTKFREVSSGPVGATEILMAILELNDPKSFEQLAASFTLEQLEHTCKKPMRSYYIDTTAEEKELLKRFCRSMTDSGTFSSRASAAYWLLRMYARHMVHEDALVPYSIVLTFCSDVLDKRYDLPYFDSQQLYSIITNAIQDAREVDSTSPTKDLLTWTCLAITYYYFEDSTIQVPTSSKELLGFLFELMKERAAENYLSTYSVCTSSPTSCSLSKSADSPVDTPTTRLA